jgi:hypothetical protein
LHLGEWDVRVVDMEAGVTGNHLPICLGGRGAAPPECCGGPTGYRLVLQRQRLGAAMSDPGLVKTGIALLAEACPEEPPQTWDLLRTVLDEGFQSIDDRLQKRGPLAPDRFSLQEANTRWNEWAQGWRWARRSVRAEVVCMAGDGSEPRREVVAIERRELTMETLGRTPAEGKALLADVQDVVAQSVQPALEQPRAVRMAGSDTPAKSLAWRRSARCWAGSGCPIRGGIAALVKATVRRPSAR